MMTPSRKPSRATVITASVAIGVFGAGAGLGTVIAARSHPVDEKTVRLAAGTYYLDDKTGAWASYDRAGGNQPVPLSGADQGSTITKNTSGDPKLCLTTTVDGRAVEGGGEDCVALPALASAAGLLQRPGNPRSTSAPPPKKASSAPEPSRTAAVQPAPDPRRTAPRQPAPASNRTTQTGSPSTSRQAPAPAPTPEKKIAGDISESGSRIEQPGDKKLSVVSPDKQPTPKKSEPKPSEPPKATQPSTTAKPARPSTTPGPARRSGTPRATQPSTTTGPAQPSTTTGPAQPSTTAGPTRPSTTAGPAQPSTTTGPAQPSTDPRLVQPSTGPRAVRPSGTLTPALRSSTAKPIVPSGTPGPVRPFRPSAVPKPTQPDQRNLPPVNPSQDPQLPPIEPDPQLPTADPDVQLPTTGPDVQLLTPGPGTQLPEPDPGAQLPSTDPGAVQAPDETAPQPATQPVPEGEAGDSLPIFQDPKLLQRAQEALGLDKNMRYTDENGVWDLNIAPPGTPECRNYSAAELQRLTPPQSGSPAIPRDSCQWPAFIRWLYAEPAQGQVSNWTKFTGLPERNLELVVTNPATTPPVQPGPGQVEPDLVDPAGS
ncbi:hypothetical protein [Streptosporangium sp. NPDC000396]|uniref:hypothetical protein n=1 Tax=Streptosporangium sp. NPDC000396 TaxID=3366185 RepID=UPI003683DB95